MCVGKVEEDKASLEGEDERGGDSDGHCQRSDVLNLSE